MSEVNASATATPVTPATEATPVTEVASETSETPTPAKRVNRRGLGTARGATRLKFSHEHAQKNGLFLTHIDSIEVTTVTIGEETTGMPSFNGLEVPRLTVTVASNEEDVLKRKYAILSFMPVESNSTTIPGGSNEWKFNQVFDWMHHILNVFVLKGKPVSDEILDAISITYNDTAEDGSYEHVDGDVVVASWKVLFENFVQILNEGKDGKAYYTNKDGKPLTLWSKLLRHVKHTKKGWTDVNNGNLSFPTFVGEGAFELVTQNAVPSLRLDTVRESIIPMNTEKAKAPNMGGMNNPMGGPAIMGGGMNMNAPMGMEDFSAGVGNVMGDEDDVPF